MVLLAISDLHGNVRALERILNNAGDCDAILLAGDLTHFGSGRDVDPIIQRCREKTSQVFAIAGNCDTKEVVRRLKELEADISAAGIVLGELGIHGLPGIPYWRPGMYQFSEDELAEMLKQGWQQITEARQRITLAHVPPQGCAVDRVSWGCHVGSVSLRQFVKDQKPHLVLCGHIHEGRGIATIDDTQIVNCGHGASGFYARIICNPKGSDGPLRVELHQA